jgi:hypothetical protein
MPVSIHAPAGGATKACASRQTLCLVSIHAPAGGATVAIVTSYNSNKINCQRAILFRILYIKGRENIKN